jgi:hypothetical protein
MLGCKAFAGFVAGCIGMCIFDKLWGKTLAGCGRKPFAGFVAGCNACQWVLFHEKLL